jgi:hypothetical protein
MPRRLAYGNEWDGRYHALDDRDWYEPHYNDDLNISDHASHRITVERYEAGENYDTTSPEAYMGYSTSEESDYDTGSEDAADDYSHLDMHFEPQRPSNRLKERVYQHRQLTHPEQNMRLVRVHS